MSKPKRDRATSRQVRVPISVIDKLEYIRASSRRIQTYSGIITDAVNKLYSEVRGTDGPSLELERVDPQRRRWPVNGGGVTDSPAPGRFSTGTGNAR